MNGSRVDAGVWQADPTNPDEDPKPPAQGPKGDGTRKEELEQKNKG
jgi:hypothetical protein